MTKCFFKSFSISKLTYINIERESECKKKTTRLHFIFSTLIRAKMIRLLFGKKNSENNQNSN